MARDTHPSLSRGGTAGFSLVEVAISVGIFTFGVTLVIGLLPMGLMTFRQAKDTSVSAELAQSLFSEWEQTDFDSMKSLAIGNYRTYDDSGTQTGIQGVKTGPVVYMANVVVISSSLPTTAGAKSLGVPSNLDTVIVQIANNPPQLEMATQANGMWTGKTQAGNGIIPMHTYTAFISRNSNSTESAQ